ncbi:MAG: type VI secretion system baseplate subunit TssG [Planctomycetota bacterium]
MTSTDRRGWGVLREPQRYELFAAIAAIERAHPARVRLGEGGPADDEVVRLLGDTSCGFAASEVTDVTAEETASGAVRYRLQTAAAGLFGAGSPLPRYLGVALEALEESYGTDVPRRFLELLEHRLLALLYRGWRTRRIEVDYATDGTDAHSQRLLGMLGLARPDEAGHRPWLLRYAGLLIRQPRSASALEGVLLDWFAPLPVAVVECVRSREPIGASERLVLGRRNHVLGKRTIVGASSQAITTTFTVRVGPVGPDQIEAFLPGGVGRRAVAELVAVVVGRELSCRLTLVVRADATVPVRLDRPGHRLGYSSSLGLRSRSHECSFALSPTGS